MGTATGKIWKLPCHAIFSFFFKTFTSTLMSNPNAHTFLSLLSNVYILSPTITLQLFKQLALFQWVLKWRKAVLKCLHIQRKSADCGTDMTTHFSHVRINWILWIVWTVNKFLSWSGRSLCVSLLVIFLFCCLITGEDSRHTYHLSPFTLALFNALPHKSNAKPLIQWFKACHHWTIEQWRRLLWNDGSWLSIW